MLDDLEQVTGEGSLRFISYHIRAFDLLLVTSLSKNGFKASRNETVLEEEVK